MNVRSFAASRGRASAIGIAMLVAAFIGADGRTSARAQGGRAVNQRAPQPPGTPANANLRGRHGPDPVKDPTAGERAEVAGRVYRVVLDEWVQRPTTTPGPGGGPPDPEARSRLELAERLGPWSLRWQEAQDNAARSLAARYQSLSDHLGRMSALEEGRSPGETGRSAGGPVGLNFPRGSTEAVRFFRPIDQWGIDRIVPSPNQSERPLNPLGVAVTPAEQVEIAGWVYRAILDEAVDRFLAASRQGETPRDERVIFDAPLAERLGSWSDLWRQAREVAARDRSSRSSAAERLAGPARRAEAMRSHVERMSELEDGRFVVDALKRAGRSAVPPADMTRFREFAEVARFFRIEAEDRLPGASRPKGAGVTDSGQAEIAGRIYRAILDGAARRYRESPRDVRLVFDPRLAERLAAWSIRRARAGADLGHASQFAAVRSHVERMSELEDGRSLHEAIGRAGSLAVGLAAPSPPHEFADAARFFRLEALWELEQVRAR